MSKAEYKRNSSDVIITLIESERKIGRFKEVAMMETRLYRKLKKRYSLDFLNSPELAAKFGQKLFKDYYDRERFYVVGITAKCEPISIQLLSIGGMESTIVDLRCLFRYAIVSGAHSILIYHNHLSLVPSPSKEDISITKRVADAGNLLGIQLRDHLILSGENYYSMKESGVL